VERGLEQVEPIREEFSRLIPDVLRNLLSGTGGDGAWSIKPKLVICDVSEHHRLSDSAVLTSIALAFDTLASA
jgi:hypothetical protein